MRLTISILVCLAMSWAVCTPAKATDIYRWVDQNGVTQYSDTPPAGTQYERVNVRAPSAPTPEPASTEADPDSPPKQASTAELRAQRCATARRNLDILRSGESVLMNVDGQAHELTASEREEQLQRAEQAVANDCDPS